MPKVPTVLLTFHRRAHVPPLLERPTAACCCVLTTLFTAALFWRTLLDRSIISAGVFRRFAIVGHDCWRNLYPPDQSTEVLFASLLNQNVRYIEIQCSSLFAKRRFKRVREWMLRSQVAA